MARLASNESFPANAPVALITGVTGQDGVLLAEALLRRRYHVVGFGRRSSVLSRTDLRPLWERMTLTYGDLRDPVSIADAIQHHQPTEIYNLASQSAPGLSWAQSVATGDVTGMGAHRLFEAARRFKPDCRIYQASSSEMFGEVLASPQDERTPFNPMNPYAAAKVYAHDIAKIYRRAYGMFIACGILFNHESRHRGMQFLTQKVTYGAACAKLGVADSTALNEEGEPVVRNGKLSLGNLDAARDWGCASDYVEAMWLMLRRPGPADYVIGTGTLRTVRQLCEVAYRLVGKDWRDHVVSDERFVRPSETGATVANAAKARSELGWEPRTRFEDMIGQMVDAHIQSLSKNITH